MPSTNEPESVMTPENFRERLAQLRWSQAEFARRVGCGRSTANRWAQGDVPIPEWVAVHLALLAEIADLHARHLRK